MKNVSDDEQFNILMKQALADPILKAKIQSWLDFFEIAKGISNAEVNVRIREGKVVLPKTAKPNETIFDTLVKDDKVIFDKKYDKLKILTSKKRFLWVVKTIRQKFSIPSNGLEKDDLISNEDSESFNNSLKDILSNFSLDDSYSRPIEWFILYNNLNYQTPKFRIKFCKDKSGQDELWIKIFANTKKEDILKLWGRIKIFQRWLPDYEGKLKKWTNFERDLEIYQTYKKCKKELQGKKRAGNSIDAVDVCVSEKICDKYPNLSITNIRKIISRFNKKIKDI